MENIISEIPGLLQFYSKERSLFLQKAAIENQEVRDELFRLAMTDIKVVCWRASWILSFISKKHSDLLLPYLDQIIAKILISKYDSQKNGLFRILLAAEFNFEKYPFLVDYCMNILMQDKVLHALKYYSIILLAKAGKQIPELKEEIIMSLKLSTDFLGKEHLRYNAIKVINQLSEKKKNKPGKE